ncbi:LSU ribosomal protein L6P [Desulfacinum hydrothermale DSM 13146]|uniref:Large ribosomal subunit protein uL6 n=1 Tax=Desulfacinum hydrothermale DSM 13146 TaxID=1121390 RepID=A0A1W1XQH8_9BACT|nr:50S ribosomal protein L6 [Desulfacinum hydrothermale]SMC26127.1 LSU ribosomal protein L6P [Desulfacinum hydrothermale DSM 13146]
MSRVGKNPVPVPQGVDVKVDGAKITVKGPKGVLTRELPSQIQVTVEGDQIVCRRADESRQARSLHGLVRALVSNMVVGVSQGFTKVLEIHGVGYRAEVNKNVLNLTLGYSHPINYELPEGIQATVDKQNVIRLEGTDREVLGQTAANIRALRPVEPYKGKGVRYADEQVRRKAGKAGKK